MENADNFIRKGENNRKKGKTEGSMKLKRCHWPKYMAKKQEAFAAAKASCHV